MNINYKFINNTFELSSKAKTLSQIRKYFSDIDIADLVFFTKNEWIKLTHLDAPISKIKKVMFTYKLEKNNVSYNLENKKYFYWIYFRFSISLLC